MIPFGDGKLLKGGLSDGNISWFDTVPFDLVGSVNHWIFHWVVYTLKRLLGTKSVQSVGDFGNFWQKTKSPNFSLRDWVHLSHSPNTRLKHVTIQTFKICSRFYFGRLGMCWVVPALTLRGWAECSSKEWSRQRAPVGDKQKMGNMANPTMSGNTMVVIMCSTMVVIMNSTMLVIMNSSMVVIIIRRRDLMTFLPGGSCSAQCWWGKDSKSLSWTDQNSKVI